MRSELHKQVLKTKEQVGTVGVYVEEMATDCDEDSLCFSCCHPSPLSCTDTIEYPCHQVGSEFAMWVDKADVREVRDKTIKCEAAPYHTPSVLISLDRKLRPNMDDSPLLFIHLFPPYCARKELLQVMYHDQVPYCHIDDMSVQGDALSHSYSTLSDVEYDVSKYLFADDDPIAGGGDGRDHSRIRKFLSQQHKKLQWKPEFSSSTAVQEFAFVVLLPCFGLVVPAISSANSHFVPLTAASTTRTTVKKLAVAPKWKNYGLRIFGFLHPYRDGDFQFSVSSDDNSEFWLSPDESPLNARLLVYVGKLGTEWTAPGEFSKFRSQSSKSVHLMSSRRYYFEILHKQDDKGSDHVEVGEASCQEMMRTPTRNTHISLYLWDTAHTYSDSKDCRVITKALHLYKVDERYESNLKMNSVDHIPQTLASHIRLPDEFQPQGVDGGSILQHGVDMLKPDPRDTFYRRQHKLLQQLQRHVKMKDLKKQQINVRFDICVYLSFVYPNDFTRLTHMERENKCFYRESPIYLEKFGFYKYMKMDEEEDDRPFFFPNPDDFLEEEEVVEAEDEAEIVGTLSPKKLSHPSQTSHTSNPSHQHSKPGPTPAGRKGDDELENPDDEEEEAVNSIVHHRERRHFPPRVGQMGRHLDREWGREHIRGNARQDARKGPEQSLPKVLESNTDSVVQGRSLSWTHTGPAELGPARKREATGGERGGGGKGAESKLSKSSLLFPQKSSLSAFASRAKQILSNSAHSNRPYDNNQLSRNKKEKKEENKIYITRPRPIKGREREQRRERREERASRHTREVFPGVFLYQSGKTTRLVNLGAKGHTGGGVTGGRSLVSAPQLWPNPPTKEESTLQGQSHVTSYLRTSEITESQHPDPDPNPAEFEQDTNRSNTEPDPDPKPEPEEGELSDYSYEEVEARPGWAEESINWQRTFSVNPMDFELLRSDWNDLRCNVSGNLQLAESEVVDVLAQYMEKLNERNGGIYTLLRIINVEKRRDSARGNRYLVELELMERGRSVVRLSEYIYLLLHHGRQGEESVENTDSAPASAPASSISAATSSHATPPPPPSTRTPVRAGATPLSTAYAKPLLCQPVMLQWRRDVMVHFVVPVKNQARWVQQFISDMENLHRQTKDDNFSIIIVDFESEDMDVEQALRESSVPRYEYLRREGNFERSAGLQIGVDTIEVRKTNTQREQKVSWQEKTLTEGYWEVNGFGLFGIYKSDFDKIGGMNTEEFKDRWGGFFRDASVSPLAPLVRFCEETESKSEHCKRAVYADRPESSLCLTD
ncbi:N-acetyl-beta-glucosaminyl-glycoprotein 4-beta-N-acetylgalactosaminyltransferase 1 [Channa argus]|uniref:Beta-1,4-N-acetylgalactosaminyltransferase n=1 Tax=Channa argus TaxID=215402 RepID=A0A6G1PFB4_CHAAH|nr:N-acetyl-beta-glucosaminyl-glycoprotein 4-beta-N-acetylgalactosaminyltransferase 1 [Channa argus]